MEFSGWCDKFATVKLYVWEPSQVLAGTHEALFWRRHVVIQCYRVQRETKMDNVHVIIAVNERVRLIVFAICTACEQHHLASLRPSSVHLCKRVRDYYTYTRSPYEQYHEHMGRYSERIVARRIWNSFGPHSI